MKYFKAEYNIHEVDWVHQLKHYKDIGEILESSPFWDHKVGSLLSPEQDNQVQCNAENQENLEVERDSQTDCFEGANECKEAQHRPKCKE